MPIPNKPSYDHGSTGSEPSSPIDYANGDPLDAEELDYYLYTEFTIIKELIDAFHALDSDDDGRVDAADTAAKVKGNDIDSNGDGAVNEADTANAYKGTDLDTAYLNADAGGGVLAGDAGTVYSTAIQDGETLELYSGTFHADNGTAVPSGCDLVIATLDNSGGGSSQATIFSGDGNTVYGGETGAPLASYANTSGSEQTVAVLVDNGEFNSGSGSDQSVYASVVGRVI